MASNNPFEELARDLPDGAFWATGAWFRKLFTALTADRARAGSNVVELPTDKGRFFNAQAGGGSAAAAVIPPFTVGDASAADADGTPHPGRVRIYAGVLVNRPEEMQIPDELLPSGTDNRCYLTMLSGYNFIYGKVLVDSVTGFPTTANVYRVDSAEDPDSTYLYLRFATVNLGDDGTLAIAQEASGNKTVLIYTAPDGTLSPAWLPLS